MLSRSFLAMALAVLALTGATLAQAASKHKVSQTIELASISQSASYPNPGSTNLAAGTVSGTLGNGAVIQNVRITGHPAPTKYTYKATGTAFYSHGTITSALTGTATVQTNGSVHVAGNGRYTGGSDSYRGASGKYTFTGTIPPANPNKPTPTVVQASGTISY